jgi:hypothetical protein
LGIAQRHAGNPQVSAAGDGHIEDSIARRRRDPKRRRDAVRCGTDEVRCDDADGSCETHLLDKKTCNNIMQPWPLSSHELRITVILGSSFWPPRVGFIEGIRAGT